MQNVPSLAGLRFASALILLILLPTLLVGAFSLQNLSLTRKEDLSPTVSPSPPSSGTESPIPTVVIDPGHGGTDGGAQGLNQTSEKDLNLLMAKQLGAMLRACGVHVIYTREDDRMLDSDISGSRKMKDLSGRLEVMKSRPDALFVSIHMNRFSSSSCHGTQIWYTPNHKDAKLLAEAMASEIRLTHQKDNNRQTKQADQSIFLLHRANSCAVLVECGFLSSPEDSLLLTDPLWRDRLAAALTRAILSRLSIPE